MATIKILPEQEILGLLHGLSGWSYKNGKLTKEYNFRKFLYGIKFIDGVSSFFEKINHHADIHIYYTKIVFELQTFDAGGKVTDLDFEVAKEIEKRYQILYAV